MPAVKTQEELDAEFKAREDAIAAREKAAEDREKQFAADREKAHNDAAAAKVDNLVASGKVLPADRDDLVKVFCALKGDELEFSATDKSSAGDKLAKIFAAGPNLVDVSGKKLSPDQQFSADKQLTAEEIEAKARKLAKEEGITFSAAVEKIHSEQES